jgi:hypothetical protein
MLEIIFKKMSTLPISKFVTVTDEAFTLLILRNNYAVWKEQTDRKKNQVGRDLRIDECENKQIYFTDKGGRGRTWTNQGKQYFNKMCAKIKKDREKHGPTFDAKFLEYILNKFKVDANEEEELEEEQVESQEIVCFADIDWAEESLENSKQKLKKSKKHHWLEK